MRKHFILWDFLKYGEPPKNEHGDIDSAGVFGVIDEGSCYLNAYAKYLQYKMSQDLKVGEYCDAEFSLSGTKGQYRIYRIRHPQEIEAKAVLKRAIEEINSLIHIIGPICLDFSQHKEDLIVTIKNPDNPRLPEFGGPFETTDDAVDYVFGDRKK